MYYSLQNWRFLALYFHFITQYCSLGEKQDRREIINNFKTNDKQNQEIRNKERKERLQWHPVFFAEMQIELEEDLQNLILENEHQLGTMPKEIDILIIKRNKSIPMKKKYAHWKRRRDILCGRRKGAYSDYRNITIIRGKNFWLKHLTNDLKDKETVEKSVGKFSEHKGDICYKSVMDTIVRAMQLWKWKQ